MTCEKESLQMQVLDLPLSFLILILFAMAAIFIFVINIRMPGNFSKDEQKRAELKKILYNREVKEEIEEIEEK